MWEEHGEGRIGTKTYCIDEQALDDNPYRASSRPNLLFGILGEITLGKVSLFANAQNLLDVRQGNTTRCCFPSTPPTASGPSMPGRRLKVSS